MRFSKLVIVAALAATTALTGCKSTQEVLKIGAAAEIEGDLEMDISFGRGPAAAGQSTATYEYFVAVTRKNIGVINKQTFPIQVTFPAGQDRVRVTERIGEIVIPRRF